MKEVLVIGAGISGLTVAGGLARQGLHVEVWEADAEPGGKIRSRVENGYLTERAASLLLNFRPEVSRFIQETGLVSCKVARETRPAPAGATWCKAVHSQRFPPNPGHCCCRPC